MSSRDEPHNTFVVLVNDLGLATTEAIAYLRAVRPERVVPVYSGPPAGGGRWHLDWDGWSRSPSRTAAPSGPCAASATISPGKRANS